MAVTNTSTSSAQLRWNDVTDAIKQGKSWLDFFPNTEIVKKTDTEMCLRMGRYEISITILAFGNFNHDGFDDMLVFYDQSVMDGTFHYSGVGVLSRTSPGGALKLIN
jgi:hypothetical protein